MAALSPDQREKLAAFAGMLREVNRKVNLISRESADEIERIHIPHVLSLTMRSFPSGARIVDWGTGGGLPAIPLAIALPDVEIHAVDAVEKKVLAVRTMARRLGLKNLHATAGDASAWRDEANYSVSRATAPLLDLWRWHRRIVRPVVTGPDAWRGGLLCLKGGDLAGEMDDLRNASVGEKNLPPHLEIETWPLRELLDDAYFDTKCIVHVYETDSD